jgi:hypothetical protein
MAAFTRSTVIVSRVLLLKAAMVNTLPGGFGIGDGSSGHPPDDTIYDCSQRWAKTEIVIAISAFRKLPIGSRCVTNQSLGAVRGEKPGSRSCARDSSECGHAESVDLAHGSCAFGGSGANSEGLACPLATTYPAFIPQGRSSGSARAIARSLPHSFPCVRYNRRPGRDRFYRG